MRRIELLLARKKVRTRRFASSSEAAAPHNSLRLSSPVCMLVETAAITALSAKKHAHSSVFNKRQRAACLTVVALQFRNGDEKSTPARNVTSFENSSASVIVTRELNELKNKASLEGPLSAGIQIVRDDSFVSIVSPPERRKLIYGDEKKRSRGRSIVLGRGIRFASAFANVRLVFVFPHSRPVIHLDGSQTRGQAQLHPRQKAARADRRFLVRRAWSARRGEASRNETRRYEMKRKCCAAGGQRRGFVVRPPSARVLCHSSAAPRSSEGPPLSSAMLV